MIAFAVISIFDEIWILHTYDVRFSSNNIKNDNYQQAVFFYNSTSLHAHNFTFGGQKRAKLLN